MSWEFGTVRAGVSDLSAATSWGSWGSCLRLLPSSWEKPLPRELWPGWGLRVGADLGAAVARRRKTAEPREEQRAAGPRGPLPGASPAGSLCHRARECV